MDRDTTNSFVAEARGHLKTVRQGLEAFASDPTRVGAIRQAYRAIHTVKGAAAMSGLSALSHIAFYVEEMFEEIASRQRTMDATTASLLRSTATGIERYLDGLANGSALEGAIFPEITRAFRRARGLPAEEDDAAVQQVLAPEQPPAAGAPAARPPEHPAEHRPKPAGTASLDVLETFIQEAEDYLQAMRASLAALSRDPGSRDALQAVRRSVHSLKGAASTVGMHAAGQLAHRMEDLLDRLFDGGLGIDPAILDLLLASMDVLESLVEGTPVDSLAGAIAELYARYAANLNQLSIDDAPTFVGAQPATVPEPAHHDDVADLSAVQLAAVAEPTAEQREKAPSGPLRLPEQMVRVPVERLDEISKLVSEMVISRTAIEQRMADIERKIEELQLSGERLRRVSGKLETQYEASALADGAMALAVAAPASESQSDAQAQIARVAKEGFDELELDRYTEFHLLTRELAETTADVASAGGEMHGMSVDLDGLLNRHRRLSSLLQDKFLRLRMTPVAALAQRLQRTVRIAAKQGGKNADLVIEGGTIELNTSVLDQLSEALQHLLRNAVAHGVEAPERRLASGKPECGAIRLRAYYDGTQVVVEVTDDGAGLDPNRLRATAVARGLLTEEEATTLSDAQALTLIFLPTFSTASEVNEVAGRGVGMDIIKASVTKLGGTVIVNSELGRGATFTIRLPMTLALARALLVHVGSETFAIPLGSVSQILRIERQRLERLALDPVIRVGEKVYPIVFLAEALQLREPPDPSAERLPVVIVKAGASQLAMIVDEVVEEREIVIKSLGNHLRSVRGILGATIMGDGSVVPILNPVDLAPQSAETEIPGLSLVQRATALFKPPQPTLTDDRPLPTAAIAQANQTVVGSAAKPPARRPTEAVRPLLVMVVDDSPSVRRVVTNLVVNAGWQPIPAKDGVDALEILQSTSKRPDTILLDVEMPRMDGYELLATLKEQPGFSAIPVVMVTSRAGEKHRRKALSLGASDYVSKPYDDETLVGIIKRLASE